MMRTCDLHTHSVYSDGTWTPSRLIDEAERLGLGAIVLSDHNTVAGLPEFMAAAEGREVEAVPGIEFSSDYDGTELHILALFVMPEYYGVITERMEDFLRRKDESNRRLVENLNRAGYRMDYGQMKARANGYINRAHIAAELTRLGYTATIQEAFQQLLQEKHGYYQPPRRMTAYETIRFIKSIGAVAVLAHPFLNLSEQALRSFLQQAVPLGLDAMETIYVSYDAETTQTATRMADEFGLKHSGGSDFHGENKPDIRLGVGKGGLAVPLELLDALKKR